ncbi:hypothetical protein A0H81_05558 [Grifola frondosa]|uniref:Uncharacterized protein n=1 Tax=Grifola frondosa TaxID=5627 RepID=A0A1C7MBN3_GRIFR|nr:hypothetical protein A0H81_05558 [Grifola frondosa]
MTHPELNGREYWTQLETLVGCDCKLDSVLYHLPCPSTTNPPSPGECRCPGLSTICLILSSPHEYFLSVRQDVAEKFRLTKEMCAKVNGRRDTLRDEVQ